MRHTTPVFADRSPLYAFASFAELSPATLPFPPPVDVGTKVAGIADVSVLHLVAHLRARGHRVREVLLIHRSPRQIAHLRRVLALCRAVPSRMIFLERLLGVRFGPRAVSIFRHTRAPFTPTDEARIWRDTELRDAATVTDLPIFGIDERGVRMDILDATGHPIRATITIATSLTADEIPLGYGNGFLATDPPDAAFADTHFDCLTDDFPAILPALWPAFSAHPTVIWLGDELAPHRLRTDAPRKLFADWLATQPHAHPIEDAALVRANRSRFSPREILADGPADEITAAIADCRLGEVLDVWPLPTHLCPPLALPGITRLSLESFLATAPHSRTILLHDLRHLGTPDFQFRRAIKFAAARARSRLLILDRPDAAATVRHLLGREHRHFPCPPTHALLAYPAPQFI